MWIETIKIEGFGKLRGTSLRLCRGMNVVIGPNESGKSTLQDFLYAMLYGPESERTFSRRLPWDGGEFGGSVVYHLEQGPGKGKVELGRDLADQTARMKGGGAKRNGVEPEEGGADFPGLLHLGVDRNVFLGTCLVRQGETFALRGKWDVSKRLLGLVESGDEDHGVDQAIQKIRELSELEIGSEERGVLAVALDRLEVLIREKEETILRREDCHENVLARRKEQVRLGKAQGRLTRFEAAEKRQEVVALERRLAEIRSLQRKIQETQEIVEGGRQIPILDREGLKSIESRQEANRETLERVAAEVEELGEKILQIRGTTEGKEAYLEMPGNATEIIAEFRAYLRSGRTQIDEGEKAMRERRRELQLARKELEGLAQRYAPFKENYEQVLQDLRASRKRKGALETRRRVLGERESQEKVAKRRVQTLRRRTTLAWVGLGLLSTGGLVAGLGGLLVAAAALGVLAILPAVLALAVLPRMVRRARGEVRRLGRRIEQYREDIDVREGVIRMKKEVYRRAGVSSPEALRQGFEKYRSLEAQIPALEEALKRESARFRKVKVEIDPREDEAVDLLQRTGCLEDGAPVTEEVVEEFNRQLREVGDLRREKEVLEGLLSLKQRELQFLEDQVRESDDEARAILEDAGVSSAEAFEILCAEEDRIREAERQLQGQEERLETFLGGSTVTELEAKLGSLLEGIPKGLDEGDEEEEDGEEEEDETKDELRDDLLRASSGESPGGETISRLQQEVQESRRRIAILDSRIEVLSKGGRHLADIESDIEEVGKRIVHLKGERIVLEETERSLRRLKEEYLMSQFAPRLEDIASPLLQELTGGRYLDLRLDEELNLKVLREGEDELKPVADLSLGTQDQVYFILRHAVGLILSESGEPLPLILDETLVAFDTKRRTSTIRLLLEFSRKRQVILFTCHQDQAKGVEEACKKANLRLEKQKAGEFEVSTAR